MKTKIEFNTSELKTQVGKRFKQSRLAIGITQTEIAQRLGLYSSSITNIELGKTFPPITTMLFMLEQYDISPTWLMTGKGEMFQGKQEENKQAYYSDPGLNEQVKDFLYHFHHVDLVRHAALAFFIEYKADKQELIKKLLEEQKKPSSPP